MSTPLWKSETAPSCRPRSFRTSETAWPPKRTPTTGRRPRRRWPLTAEPAAVQDARPKQRRVIKRKRRRPISRGGPRSARARVDESLGEVNGAAGRRAHARTRCARASVFATERPCAFADERSCKYGRVYNIMPPLIGSPFGPRQIAFEVVTHDHVKSFLPAPEFPTLIKRRNPPETAMTH